VSTHQIIASTTGKYVTTCRLCRTAVAKAPALEIPTVGAPGKRFNDLITVLTKHLVKHHAQEFKEGAALLDEILYFLVLTAFEHEDPSVDPKIEAIRAHVFQKVRKNSFADAMLDHIVAGFGLDPDDADKVNQAMRAVRDACCEFGQYAPQNGNPPAPSPLITA
jgi:hypothetical protein